MDTYWTEYQFRLFQNILREKMKRSPDRSAATIERLRSEAKAEMIQQTKPAPVQDEQRKLLEDLRVAIRNYEDEDLDWHPLLERLDAALDGETNE